MLLEIRVKSRGKIKTTDAYKFRVTICGILEFSVTKLAQYTITKEILEKKRRKRIVPET